MIKHDKNDNSIIRYTIGFVTSLLITLLAYSLITNESISGWALKLVITGLALAQLLVQLVCFLHINTELKPRWKLLVFAYTVMTVTVLVFGSIWIMYNLDYNHSENDHMSGQEIKEFIQHDEGIQH